jgi:hypothetical protein
MDIIHEIGKRSNYKNYATLLLTSKEYYNAKFLTDLKLRSYISEYPNVDELLVQAILLDDVFRFNLIEELRFGNFTLPQIGNIIEDVVRTDAIKIFENVISRFNIESLPQGNFDNILKNHIVYVKTSSIIVSTLLNSMTQNYYDFFSEACAAGNVYLVKKLLQDRRFDPRCVNNEAFLFSCQTGRSDIVKLLLKDGRVNPFLPNNRPLLDACRAYNSHLMNDYNKIVKLLLEHPLVDPNFNNGEAVKHAAEHHNWSIVCTILRHQRVNLSNGLLRNLNFPTLGQ